MNGPWRLFLVCNQVLVCALMTIVPAVTCGQALAAPRVALVVGNGAYHRISALRNPVNDAELMAGTLRGLGFDVSVATDADQQEFKSAIRDFGRRLRKAGSGAVGLFYYAGHGLQSGGHNYLVPIDAPIEEEADLEFEAVPARWVLSRMEAAGNALNVVILDACRNNPFRSGFRSGLRGLTRMPAPTGSLIAYSAGPGQAAEDGDGRNSPYTLALAEALEAPGLKVEEVFKRVRNTVRKRGVQQTPWEESSLMGDFYFRAGASAAASAASDRQSESSLEGRAKAAFEGAKFVHTIAAYRLVVEQFPGHFYAALAQAQIDKMTGGGPRPSDPAAPGRRFRDCEGRWCPELVVVPAGSFMMGSPASEEGRRNAEGPVHRVTIERPFAVGVYEVTFAEWDACVSGDGCGGYRPGDEGWGRGNRPVVNVSWNHAQAYLEWLSSKMEKKYRLLSESEWEYVARAGTKTAYHFGTGISLGQANYDRWNGKTVPVGSYPPNAFGLHDVHGNVSEWVEDCWNTSYQGALTDGSAWKIGNCSERVQRGGSSSSTPKTLRSAFRHKSATGARYVNVGFRIARTLTP